MSCTESSKSGEEIEVLGILLEEVALVFVRLAVIVTDRRPLRKRTHPELVDNGRSLSQAMIGTCETTDITR